MATHTADSASQTDVAAKITLASAGDTVIVPAGSATWSSLSVSKAITLQGSGQGVTNIAVTGDRTIAFTKQAAGIIRCKNFSFSVSSISTRPMYVTGSWLSAEPVIFENNAFTMSAAGMFDVFVCGGVIFSANTISGGWDDFFAFCKDLTNASSWTTAGTMGTADTTGKINIYLEGNTISGCSNGVIDADDNCRVVYRYNNHSHGGFNSHGWDTSPYGLRQFEIYNNTWTYTDTADQINNVNQHIWIRGGTGVIYNNQHANLGGTNWGAKPEWRVGIRGAEDNRPQGICANVSYPVPHQVGRGHNGTSEVSEPVYVWGNTGTTALSADWAWGNPCGLTFSDFFQVGRDWINDGTQKPGYTAYTYPHPLASAAVAATSRPGGMRFSPRFYRSPRRYY